ncbi:MAG TPA: ribonuclease III [Coriobacteriia bacterium]|nr:ribonuclease III [Coriobacteriia bacterium]
MEHPAGSEVVAEQVQGILGYEFKDTSLLIRALTHPSVTDADQINDSYERLEFLGDSLLGAFIARVLYERFPRYDEGCLTRIKVSLVSGGNLSKVAESLGLADFIIFGSSERGTGKRGLASALENVYEAITAAIALDGGQDEAFTWVYRTLNLDEIDDSAAKIENPKSNLQEILQVNRITPTYELVETSGPPHARTFTSNVLSDGKVIGTGTGRSKKDAESAAAESALKRMRGKENRKKPE